MALIRPGRGASLPANPYSFVVKHHVSRAKQGFNGPGPAALTQVLETAEPFPSAPHKKTSDAASSAAVGDFLSFYFFYIYLLFFHTMELPAFASTIRFTSLNHIYVKMALPPFFPKTRSKLLIFRISSTVSAPSLEDPTETTVRSGTYSVMQVAALLFIN